MHDLYMRRCFDLARLGATQVSPNPMVGAVLVADDRVIGEGWHRAYGQAHAEVNAVASVKASDRHLLGRSTLYVSLEPCCIYGRTPPCTDLIRRERIPRVVISTIDLTEGVGGQGVEILRDAGIEVITGILEAEGRALASIRNIYVSQKRPYIVLKFARTRDRFFAQSPHQQTWLTGPHFRRLVHRWRTHTQAILVGAQTVLSDDPQLTDRFFGGPQPLRIVIDRNLRVPQNARIFQDGAPTLLVTTPSNNQKYPEAVKLFPLPANQPTLPALLAYLYDQKISHLTVEGGAYTLEQFIQSRLWDEARVATSPVFLSQGIPSPHLPVASHQTLLLDQDQIDIYFYQPNR